MFSLSPTKNFNAASFSAEHRPEEKLLNPFLQILTQTAPKSEPTVKTDLNVDCGIFSFSSSSEAIPNVSQSQTFIGDIRQTPSPCSVLEIDTFPAEQKLVDEMFLNFTYIDTSSSSQPFPMSVYSALSGDVQQTRHRQFNIGSGVGRHGEENERCDEPVKMECEHEATEGSCMSKGGDQPAAEGSSDEENDHSHSTDECDSNDSSSSDREESGAIGNNDDDDDDEDKGGDVWENDWMSDAAHESESEDEDLPDLIPIVRVPVPVPVHGGEGVVEQNLQVRTAAVESLSPSLIAVDSGHFITSDTHHEDMVPTVEYCLTTMTLPPLSIAPDRFPEVTRGTAARQVDPAEANRLFVLTLLENEADWSAVICV